jgi:hypothetical protein
MRHQEFKDTKSSGRFLADTNDQVLGTRAAKIALPLFVAPVLSAERMKTIDSISLMLPSGTNESGSPDYIYEYFGVTKTVWSSKVIGRGSLLTIRALMHLPSGESPRTPQTHARRPKPPSLLADGGDVSPHRRSAAHHRRQGFL